MSASFIRNSWYVAAWPEEVSRTPFRRTYLGDAITLFRKEDGSPVALRDSCPHRFVPLSRGTLIHNEIECPYHGLRFDSSGRCTLNPHGDHKIPGAARVGSYPLLEIYGLVWIWMGEENRADPTLIPDFSIVGDRVNHAAATGYFNIKAYYELINDNLLDLSHVEYLHPHLRTADEFTPRLELVQKGDTVWSMRYRDNVSPNNLMKMFWTEPRGDSRAHMRWDPPSLLYLDVGITGVGRPVEEGVAVPSVHLLTPETDTSTHYFWAFIRNRKIHDADLTERIRKVGKDSFELEDKPIIESQQENMGTTDLNALRPVLLAPDAPAARARRVLAQKLAAENAIAAE